MVLAFCFVPIRSLATPCDGSFQINIGAQMAQPSGAAQFVTVDCSADPECDSYFDVELQAGAAAELSLCPGQGAGASFDASISIFSNGTQLRCQNDIDDDCDLNSFLDFMAPSAGVYRFSVDSESGTGTYTLRYRFPAGSRILTCGNGTVEAGEQCDRGTLNGASDGCCTSNCTLQPADTACDDDGNACTSDRCGGTSASCQHPFDVCDPNVLRCGQTRNGALTPDDSILGDGFPFDRYQFRLDVAGDVTFTLDGDGFNGFIILQDLPGTAFTAQGPSPFTISLNAGTVYVLAINPPDAALPPGTYPYTLRVDCGGQPGTPTPTASPTPTPTSGAGTCQNPIEFPAGGGTVAGSTTGGVNRENGSCGMNGSPEQVYRWFPNRSGMATADTCGSAYDTVLSVRRGSCTSDAEIACNDDSCGTQSMVTFPVTVGSPYFIVVDGFNGDSGDFELHVQGPAVSSCVGDCSGNSVVTLDEIVTGVGIALGSKGTNACPAFDGAPADGLVDVHELVSGIGNSLNGCRVGCSDGTREGFTDTAAFPNIAACAGGWSVAGVLPVRAPACGRLAGNDSGNPSGADCNVADLCQDGWHVCSTSQDVADSGGGTCDPGDFNPSGFYVTRQSGSGGIECGPGANDLFGCGNEGDSVSTQSCTPLKRFSNDLCGALDPTWNCGADATAEANNVTKSDASHGGVLCCRGSVSVIDLSHDREEGVGFGAVNNERRRFQTFTANSFPDLTGVRVKIKRFSASTGQSDVVAELFATDDGDPTGAVLASAGASEALVPQEGFVELDIPVRFSGLVDGADYAIVLGQQTPSDGSMYQWAIGRAPTGNAFGAILPDGTVAREDSLGNAWLQVYVLGGIAP